MPRFLLPTGLCRQVFCLMLMLASAAIAQAAPRPGPTSPEVAEAEGLAAVAKERFRSKDFETAAKLFMQAYALVHEPALVYNAARAYEEAGRPGDATGLFKLYISLTDDAQGAAEARERVRRLEGQPPSHAGPVPGEQLKGDAHPPTAPAVDPSRPSGPPTVAQRAPPAWLPWSTGGTAGVSLAAGITLMVLGRAASMDANDRYSADVDAYDRAFGAAQNQWWTGVALTGVGVGLAGLTTWLWLRDGSADVAVVPAARGVGVAVRF